MSTYSGPDGTFWYDERVTTDPGLDLAVTEALDRGDDAETVAARFGMTLEAVQATCGERGHTWETFTNGDDSTPYWITWTVCTVCGADDNRSGEDPAYTHPDIISDPVVWLGQPI